MYLIIYSIDLLYNEFHYNTNISIDFQWEKNLKKITFMIIVAVVVGERHLTRRSRGFTD